MPIRNALLLGLGAGTLGLLVGGAAPVQARRRP